MFTRLILSATFTMLTGCAAYHTPGRGANLAAIGVSPEAQKAGASADINASFDKRPLANFPAGVAVVRIQAPGYSSPTAQGFGSGAYSIVLTRDIESDTDMQRLAKLPMIRGIAPIGRLLLPSRFQSDQELRSAAAEALRGVGGVAGGLDAADGDVGGEAGEGLLVELRGDVGGGVGGLGLGGDAERGEVGGAARGVVGGTAGNEGDDGGCD